MFGFDNIFNVLSAIVDVLRRRPLIRIWVLGISLLLASAGGVLGALTAFNIYPDLKEPLQQTAVVLVAVFGFLSLLSIISYSSIDFRGNDYFDFELDRLREERNTIQERISDAPKSEDVIDTIQLNLNQLNEYYVINKSQARTSFGFSVFAIVAGLITIIGGVWIFYFQESPNFQLTAITSVAGILAEFIGAAYFYVYRKSLEQLNFFFMQLVRMQDTMLSVSLCEQIAPEERQMQLRGEIILTLLERNPVVSQSSN